MATKREVMIAGIPAKLSHMLASDVPATVEVPGVSDQNSAALLETNFVALTGSIGAVRLPPATGQYLHVLLNLSNGDQLVYPDGSETINALFPGQPAILPGGQLMIAVPSRRQWAAGTLNGLAGAEEPMEITGPLVVGVPTPSPEAAEGAVVATQFALRPGANPGNPTQAIMFWNIYNDDNGAGHYLGNGPAGSISVNLHNYGGTANPVVQMGLTVDDNNTAGSGAPVILQTGMFHVVYGVPGGPPTPIAYVGNVDSLPYPLPVQNSMFADQFFARALPSTSLPQDAATLIGLNVYYAADGGHFANNGPGAILQVRQWDPQTSITMSRVVLSIWDINANGIGAPLAGGLGGINLCYGPPGQAPNPFVVIGSGTNILPNMVSSPPIIDTLFANQLVSQPVVMVPGGQNAARVGLNAYMDNTGTWRFLQNGPAGLINSYDQYPTGTPNVPNVQLVAYPIGSAGASVVGTASNALYLWAGTLGANQTALGIDYSPDGSTHVGGGRVMVGNANTGPGGVGRALYLM